MKIELRKYSSVDALKNPTVGELFPRYSSIILGDAPAKFRIAKRIVVDFDKSMSDKELWTLHERTMKKFDETLSMIDKGKLDMNELDIPRFSLIDLKIKLVEHMMNECVMCERMCRAGRLSGKKGKCRVADTSSLSVSSEFVHLGEEPHISPSHTVFMMGCNMDCQYCQNWRISKWSDSFTKLPPLFLARVIKKRHSEGARNVNWVGGEPTPHLLGILNVLKACETNSPQIWNSNFYMTEGTMKVLNGIVDMYLSDFKYGNDECARMLSKVENYFDVVSRNHKLAAESAELTVRHLLLPEHFECCTKPVIEWISRNIRNKALVNIMGQYRPEYRAYEYIDIGRSIEPDEIKDALNHAEKLKLFFMN